MFDEMAVRQYLDFRSIKYYGRVNVGNELDHDTSVLAKDCLICMIVCINEGLKLSVGQFLTSISMSIQKAELTKQVYTF